MPLLLLLLRFIVASISLGFSYIALFKDIFTLVFRTFLQVFRLLAYRYLMYNLGRAMGVTLVCKLLRYAMVDLLYSHRF